MSTKVLSHELTQKERIVFEGLLSKVLSYQKEYKGKEGTVFIIRAANVNDIGQVVKLLKETWPGDSDPDYQSHSTIKTLIKNSLENSNPIILVAKGNDKIVAFMWGCDLPRGSFPELTNYLSKIKDIHISYLDEIAVDLDFRRRGIGSELLDSYREIARKKGVGELVLRTSSTNERAKELYEKKHYVQMVDPESKKNISKREGDDTYYYYSLKI